MFGIIAVQFLLKFFHGSHAKLQKALKSYSGITELLRLKYCLFISQYLLLYNNLILFVVMIVPSELGTKERKNNDLNDLRIYYMICEDLGIVENEDIQKSFFHLMKWAGNYKFLEEFQIFRNYIDKLKKDRIKM